MRASHEMLILRQILQIATDLDGRWSVFEGIKKAIGTKA